MDGPQVAGADQDSPEASEHQPRQRPVAEELAAGTPRGDENQGDGEGGQTTCDSSALTPGAVVHEAELRIDSNGATFRKIEIVQ